MRFVPKGGNPIVLCLSHATWDSPEGRLHHLMTRAAATCDVVIWEPMRLCPKEREPLLRMQRRAERMLVATPTVPAGLDVLGRAAAQRKLLDGLIYTLDFRVAVAYCMTRQALDIVSYLDVPGTVLDLVEEALEVGHSRSSLLLLEQRLLRLADLVVTDDPEAATDWDAVWSGTRHLLDRLLHPARPAAAPDAWRE